MRYKGYLITQNEATGVYRVVFQYATIEHIDLGFIIDTIDNEVKSSDPIDNDPEGECPSVSGGDHSYSWSGRVPNSGLYRCIFCGIVKKT